MKPIDCRELEHNSINPFHIWQNTQRQHSFYKVPNIHRKQSYPWQNRATSFYCTTGNNFMEWSTATHTHELNHQHNSNKNTPVSSSQPKHFNGIGLKTSPEVIGLVHSEDSKPKKNGWKEQGRYKYLNSSPYYSTCGHWKEDLHLTKKFI